MEDNKSGGKPDEDKYYGGLKAKYPEGDLHAPWERYSASPVAMPDYNDKFQPYYTRERIREQIASFDRYADRIEIRSNGSSEDEIDFAVRSKLTRKWFYYTYPEKSPLAKYLYRKVVGYDEDRPRNINLRRCRWGSDECQSCLECVSDIEVNDVRPHTENELEQMNSCYLNHKQEHMENAAIVQK